MRSLTQSAKRHPREISKTKTQRKMKKGRRGVIFNEVLDIFDVSANFGLSFRRLEPPENEPDARLCFSRSEITKDVLLLANGEGASQISAPTFRFSIDVARPRPHSLEVALARR